MIEKYLNQEAWIGVLFSNYGVGGVGLLPILGRITSVNNEYVEIVFDPQHKENKCQTTLKNTSGKMIVNKQCLSFVTLI